MTRPELLPYAERLVGVERAAPPARGARDDYARDQARAAAAGSKRKTFASFTLALGDEGLALFNRLPSSAWWVRTYDLEKVLAAWGLDCLPGIVACGAGAPSETVLVADHIDSPRVAPMMAETFGRLAKQRAIAEGWLFRHPEAAAIGLVPDAVAGKPKARAFARGALARLVEGGQADLVRDVAARYGAEVQAELLDLLGPPRGAARSKSKKKAARTTGPDLALEAEARDLEQQLRRATAGTAAYELVDRLGRIDTDRALFAIAELAAKARSRPLRRRAAQALAAARARRGLSEDDLAVRMIPRLGLDDPWVTLRGERHRLAASPALEPRLVAPDGTRAATLPQGAPAALRRRWELLRKELRTLSRATRDRLERRMVAGDAWSGEAFLAHVVGHPVLVELARGLLLRAGDAWFRVAEDGTLADEEDALLRLPAGASVVIPHPLDVPAARLARWAERFAEYSLVQPFEQLGRAHHRVAVKGGRVPSLVGRTLPSGAVLGLERRGWERGHIDHGPTLCSMVRALPGLTAHVSFEPGVRLDAPTRPPTQRVSDVSLSLEAGATPPARSLSELARDLGRDPTS